MKVAGIVNAQQHGWATLRRVIFARDGGCVAGQWRVFGKDIADEPCKDQFGDEIPYDTFALLEADHVTKDGVRIDAEPYLITACPWHHRLSQRWRTDSKAHRQAEREWLAKQYPAEWAA